jgi:hypothetical protein
MNEENEQHISDVEKAMSQLVEKVRQLGQSIQEAIANREEVWFGNLLLGILNCALLDFHSVEVGARQSIYLAAWGRRNLLELKTITDYVLASQSNAIDFKNDLVVDAKEFYEAITKSHRASHKTLLSVLGEMSEIEEGSMKEILKEALRKETELGPQTAATDSEAAAYKQLMVEFGLKENAKPKRVSEIARFINKKEEFDPMFKICSKIMHRTVLSIASSTIKGSLDAAIPFLTSSSASDLATIYDLINRHFKVCGIQPPEN